MESSIAVLLFALFILQYPAALLVRLDAKRLNIETPEQWRLAVVFLFLGWIVVAVYLYRRDELADHGN